MRRLCFVVIIMTVCLLGIQGLGLARIAPVDSANVADEMLSSVSPDVSGDSREGPEYGLLSTACWSLGVWNIGQSAMGGMWPNDGDMYWFSEEETFLFEEGLVICYDDTDNSCFYSVLSQTGTDFVSTESLFAMAYEDFEFGQGKYTTPDGVLCITHQFYIPTTEDSCFIIQKYKIKNCADTTVHITVGQAADWDILGPAWESSFFDSDRDMIYQHNWEDYCAGVSFCHTVVGAITLENDEWIYPNSGYLASDLCSLLTHHEGFTYRADSIEDMNTVYVVDRAVELDSAESIFYCMVMASSATGPDSLKAYIDRGKEWLTNHELDCPWQINLSEMNFTFEGEANGDNPDSQTLIITANTDSLQWSAFPQSSWLSVAPDYGTAPDTVNLQVEISGLAADAYYDTVYVGSIQAHTERVIVELLLSPEVPGPADVNGDGTVNISDWADLQGYLCGTEPAPDPLANGDPTHDCIIDWNDLAPFLDYIFSGGPIPTQGCLNPETISDIGETDTLRITSTILYTSKRDSFDIIFEVVNDQDIDHIYVEADFGTLCPIKPKYLGISFAGTRLEDTSVLSARHVDTTEFSPETGGKIEISLKRENDYSDDSLTIGSGIVFALHMRATKSGEASVTLNSNPLGVYSDGATFLWPYSCFSQFVEGCVIVVSDNNYLRVPGQYPTIQSAVDDHLAGWWNSRDTIVVSDGLYFENVVMGDDSINGMHVAIASEYVLDGDTSHILNTIIDGNGNGSTIFCNSYIEPPEQWIRSLSIIGLTVQNGTGTPMFPDEPYFISGGGVFCSMANLELEYCIVRNSTADFGAGVYNNNGAVHISNCSVYSNVAAVGGGGLCIDGMDPVSIHDCSFSNNSAVEGAGGILLTTGSEAALISNCVLVGNFTEDTEEFGYGGAVAISSESIVNISNCTIVQNSSRMGGAISIWGTESFISVDDCILAFNASDSGGVIGCFDGDADIVISCTDIYGHVTGDWVGCISDQSDINGNFSLDPLFCDTTHMAWDLDVDSLSPCAHYNNGCGVNVGALGFIGCNPCYDTDGDGYGDPDHPENVCPDDNCPFTYNPDQEDTDGDSIGDSCDVGDADFIAAPLCGIAPILVDFTDQSEASLELTEWYWDFGDDQLSTDQNPSHEYTEAGTYDVTLIVSNGIYADTMTKDDYIVAYDALVADFNAWPTHGNVSEYPSGTMTCMFEPLAEGPVSDYFWDFGNGETSTERNPIIQFTPGKYDVKLRVTVELVECSDVDSVFKGDFIVFSELSPSYSADNRFGQAGLVVQFTDESVGVPDPPTEWFWDFGDDVTSTDQNPSHQYNDDGEYDVLLRVSNSTYTDSVLCLGYIKIADDYPDLISVASGPEEVRPGFTTRFWATWDNAGSDVAEDCTLKILITDAVILDTTCHEFDHGWISPQCEGGYYYRDDTLVAILGDILPFEDDGGYYDFELVVDPSLSVGETLHWESWLNGASDELNYDNNYSMLDITVVGSIDPNDKLASPVGLGPLHRISADQRISYLIQFENKPEATAEAIYVRIVDTLDADLDWGSLTEGPMSHPDDCIFQFDPYTGVITWSCDSIMLPPNLKPPEGEGFVSYSIMPKPDAEPFTEIENLAWIRFDFNEWLQAPESGPVFRTITGPYLCGDADFSGGVDIDDVVYLINYIFGGGPVPDPLASGDADCAGGIDIDDVVYLINYIFGGGPEPCDPDGDEVPDC